jgi:FkbM family methyltransferase
MRSGAWGKLVVAANERARQRVSPETKQRLRRLVSWMYWRQRRLRRLVMRSRGSSADVLGWLPVDPLPAGALECLVATNEYGTYCVPQASQHRPVAQAILLSRVWEEDTLDLVRDADLEGDIVHAGTFFGDFLPALARSRTNGALVWAFEPGGENFRCAERTVLLNDLHNVVLTHAALGSEPGTALLQTTNNDGVPLGGASRLLRDPMSAGAGPKEEVQVVAVDEVIGRDRRVAVIHFDVEGHERFALTGAMQTIERCRPLIVLETLPVAWVAEELAPLGYESGGSIDGNVILRCSPQA